MTILHSGLQLNGTYRLIRQLGKGGFGETWEIEVNGQPKVLKILLEDFPKAIELFQREANVLSQLTHPGIPKAEADSYFCCVTEGSSVPVHGYIMQKISGVNLSDWMTSQSHKPLGQRQVLRWLTQLAEILAYLHGNGFYHRDIKPSNIMLTDAEQLVLIDFGGVKEATKTQLQNQLGDRTGTRLSTQGYTPAEQIDGTAVEQSDFFALGRTCTYLLTGSPPTAFGLSAGKLLWKKSAPACHAALASFIDELMAPFPEHRPQQASDILARIPYIQRVIDRADPIPVEKRSWGQKLARFFHSPSVVPVPVRLILFGFSTVSVSLLIFILRSVAALQPLELAAYDQLLQSRPLETADNRLVVVTVSEADRAFQKQEMQLPFRGDWQSVSDTALVQMIETLSEAQPQTIGLDILLDYLPNDDAGRAIAQQLVAIQANDSASYPTLTTICQVDRTNDIFPFPGADPASLGFNNFENDGNRMVRRHILFDNFVSNGCNTAYSFSLLLADQYLESQAVMADLTEEGLQYDNVLLAPIDLPFGGYRTKAVNGQQILLNYRSLATPTDIALTLSLTDILTKNFDPEQLKGRIILIGADQQASDEWRVPGDISISGVFVHAHMVSQLISAVLDERPLIVSLPRSLENIAIIALGSLGGSIAILGVRAQLKVLIYLLSLLALIVLSLILLTGGLWFPVLPTAIGLTGSYGLTTLCVQSKFRKKLLQ